MRLMMPRISSKARKRRLAAAVEAVKDAMHEERAKHQKAA